jgi:hypothetical protein
MAKAKAAKPNGSVRSDTFSKLKALLAEHASRLTVTHDTADNYYLDGPISPHNNKPIFFGAVQQKKSYVSYHLMPIYIWPELITDLPESLANRMQGKSCFNFQAIDDRALRDLRALTRKSFQRFREAFLKKPPTKKASKKSVTRRR